MTYDVSLSSPVYFFIAKKKKKLVGISILFLGCPHEMPQVGWDERAVVKQQEFISSQVSEV